MITENQVKAWDSEVEFFRSELAEANKRADDLERTFELRWSADMRAIKAWQSAGEGRERTWPDHADLCTWLLERDAAAVAQQAAMAEELRRYTADHDCDAEDGRGCSRCGRSESEARRERSARASLSSLSPRAAHLLAVMAANAKWQRSRRASPMDVAGELAGFVELTLALDALYGGK